MVASRSRARHYAPAVIAGLLAILTSLAVRLADPPVVAAMRGAAFDTFQRLWPRQNVDAPPVRVVDIDERSLAEFGQWPWPRTRLAQMVERLTDLGAATVAFDIIFPEPDRLSPRLLATDPTYASAFALNPTGTILPDNDEIFAQSIVDRPVVLAFSVTENERGTPPQLKSGFAQVGEPAWQAPPPVTRMLTNLAPLNNAASGLGGISLDLAETQGITRQVPMLWSDGEHFYPSLAIEALRLAQGAENIVIKTSNVTENAIEEIRVGDFTLPVNENGLFTVYFRPNSKELYVSAADVLGNNHEALRSKIEGQVVFVGTSATGLLDVRTTPLGELVPGVSVHAQVAEQIISSTYLKRPEWVVGAELILLICAGMLALAASAFLRTTFAIVSLATLMIAVSTLAVQFFRQNGMLLDPISPIASIILAGLATLAFRLLVTDRESRKLRNAFAHYVAPSILSEIERNPQDLKLGGQQRDITVMFVDIVNFTPISERCSPEELLALTNRVLDVASQAILVNEGTIDKYIGDAVMAFWNAPTEVADHQLKAIRAALDIRSSIAALKDDTFVSEIRTRRKLDPVGVRIGIASGPAFVGNMGTEARFDYSAIGTTVNRAARTESAAKELGCDILVSAPITPSARSINLEPAGHVQMKGIAEPQEVWRVIGTS